jgi:aldose 1-epimerase
MQDCVWRLQMRATSRPFGSSPKGPVTLYTIESDCGISARIMDYGATLVSLRSPDKNGGVRNIVLGFDCLEDYLADDNFLGVIVGRFANRIANASFELRGQRYDLPANNGINHIHGGPGGFDKALWTSSLVQDSDGCGVKLVLNSPHLDQGYPGNLDVRVDYRLAADGTFSINFTATPDQATFVNMTSHTYFNLSLEKGISGHHLKLFASVFTPVGKGLIPTGQFAQVEGTPFDFRTQKSIDFDQMEKDPQLAIANGYDHNFAIDGVPGSLRPVARVWAPDSGRTLLVSSTQPGVQFYSGNNLGGIFKPQNGFCLETQHFPDCPNQPSFSSALVLPEKPYAEKIEYKFGTEAQSNVL